MTASTISAIDVLLADHTPDAAWRRILLTHATLAHPARAAGVVSAPEFEGVELLDVDVLAGYELGVISTFYEYTLAVSSPDSRKSAGQYFTPDDVSRFMVSRAAGFGDGVWLDPASGVGNLSSMLASVQPDPERFVERSLLLVDRDPTALLIARTLLHLRFSVTNPHLFTDLAARCLLRDFLGDEPLPDFDFAILNPPYAAAPADLRFETFESRDWYVYFLERVMSKARGFVSVTPQNFTNGAKYSVLRRLLLDYDQLDVFSFDNMPDTLFRGVKYGSTNTNLHNSSRASVTVAVNNGGPRVHRITPLLRWAAAERGELFARAPHMLSAQRMTVDKFPKNYAALSDLYAAAREWRPLAELVSPKRTAYRLVMPSTPRYYISATKRALTRSSYREVFFRSQGDLDLCYPLLNSSYMYWWWHVNGDGMMLTKGLTESLPVPPTLCLQLELVAALEASELVNLTVKMNAGKPNENVKHPLDLVERVTATLFDAELAAALRATHRSNNTA